MGHGLRVEANFVKERAQRRQKRGARAELLGLDAPTEGGAQVVQLGLQFALSQWELARQGHWLQRLGQLREIVEVTVAHGGRGALGFEGGGGVGAHGLVQPEPVCSRRSLDDGLVDQR